MASSNKNRSQGHKMSLPSNGAQTDTLEERIKEQLTSLGLLEPLEVREGGRKEGGRKGGGGRREGEKRGREGEERGREGEERGREGEKRGREGEERGRRREGWWREWKVG